MTSRRPLTQQLLDYLDGLLDEAEQVDVERLLARSEQARRRLDWLIDFRSQVSRTHITAPPRNLRPALMEAFRHLRQVHAAEVLHDSRDVADVRSVGTADRWAVIHTSDVADVAIDFARAGDRVDVSGQVLALGDRTCQGVELMSATDALATCQTDVYGQYSCGELVAGEYRLLVHLDDATVSVDLAIDEDEIR